MRRGLAARRQRLLSDAALASAQGDRERASALRTKAAGLRMRTDAEAVRRVAAEGRHSGPAKPWESARAANAGRVAADARLQAAELEKRAGQAEPGVDRTLRRAAGQLRSFAAEIRPQPTQAQKIASRLMRDRQPSIEADRDV